MLEGLLTEMGNIRLQRGSMAKLGTTKRQKARKMQALMQGKIRVSLC